MAGETFPGQVAGVVIEVRFSFSGKVSFVSKKVGDTAKIGETLAKLDQTLLQKELDSQLADYEKVRADFEIFNLKNTAVDQITKYQKTIAQADLNSSVKAVELAKARMDQAVIGSPVNGLIINIGGLVPGVNVTPSGSPIQILDFAQFTFTFEIPQEKLSIFRQPHRAKVNIPNLGRELDATTYLPLPGDSSKVKFQVAARIPESSDLLPGMAGHIELTQ